MKVDILPLRCWLLMTALNFALARHKLTPLTPIYYQDGGELTLDVRPPPPEPLTNILWIFQSNTVAEWVKDDFLTYYGTFIGRTALDLFTGRLVINKITKADMGVYSVTVNNKVQNEKYNAVWIKVVPQPEVWIRPFICSPAFDSCTLSCYADTTDAGPVTYSWKMGDGEWKESGKDLDITKSGTSDVKTFTCRIQNPVSERDSEPKRNPLLKEPESSGVYWWIVAAIIVVLAVVVVALWCFNIRGDTSLDATDEYRPPTPAGGTGSDNFVDTSHSNELQRGLWRDLKLCCDRKTQI
ncbi:CD48 antigen-like [Perca flavescens]|uniref:CD48 antigen-like n=1 Tax=Perca flavescens TaxID=8167 RepID=UPI00106E1BFA|nr:CD48 antigen-like [Perca flavescens]